MLLDADVQAGIGVDAAGRVLGLLTLEDVTHVLETR
jgi:hypothetical protein